MDQFFIHSRFIFTFVRNPWDRLVSLYYYFRRLKRFFAGTFAEFIEAIGQGIPPLGPYNYYLLSMANPQTAWLDLGNGREPDFIGRFEHFERDWERLGDLILDNAQRPVISHTIRNKNESFRPQAPYQESYTPDTRDIVARHCKSTIERFGYEFE